MAYQDIANVTINLQTTTGTAAGFGIQLIIGEHAWFRERVKSYGSLTAASVDIPSTSKEYAALSAAFAQSPAPISVKVGRRTSSTTITPNSAINGTTYSLVVEVNGGLSVLASYTAVVPTDTQFEIVTALKAAIDGDVNVSPHVTTSIVGVGAAATLVIAATAATDEYKISSLTNVTASFASTETAADVLAAIEVVDNDFYFVTGTDHTDAYVLAMAAAIETRKKMYFVSSQSETVLATLAAPATDIFGQIFDLNYLRTVTLYHQTANTTYPECAFIANWSTSTPGTVAWYAKTLSGVSAGTALNGGSIAVPLSLTQKDNLNARNANFTHVYRGVTILEGGKTSGGEWIDVIRSMDYIEDQTELAIFNLMLNNPKITYDDIGISTLRNTCTSTWNRFISLPGKPNILDAQVPYIGNFPSASEVSFADKSNRVYNATATLYLAGAIKVTYLIINLTYL